jgi:polyisoprenoid-binding protein YceI
MTTALSPAHLTAMTGEYILDPAHTRIGFVARHAMVTKVRGAFTDFTGLVHFDGADPGSSTVSLTIRTASIDTGNDQRDQHLRNNDFLEVDTYPEITFTSTGFHPLDEETLRLTGDLTVKGITRSISIDFAFQGAVQDPFGNQRIGFEGVAEISRKEYGVTWNAALETGGVLVGDRITLELDVSATKQS